MNKKEGCTKGGAAFYIRDVNPQSLVVAHTCNNNDDDKNPQNHIEIEISAATTAVVATTFTHACSLLSFATFMPLVVYTMFFYKIW